MKRQTMTGISLMLAMLALVLPATLLWPLEVRAQSMSDYTAIPPFVSNTVPANILLLLDNSGSMNNMAYTTAFNTATTYSGLFDATECYSYSSNVFQPDPSANPATPGTCTNASYPWSGNLLNYAAQREIDMVKWVMVGGMCNVARDAQFHCSQVKGQDNFTATCCLAQTQSVTVVQATGRMPAANIPASGSVYFHIDGGNSTLQGTFCVDNDNTPPSSGAANCSDADGYAETNWKIVVNHPETTGGVIQQVGAKARFALMEFNTSQGGHLAANMGSSVATMVSGIETTTPATYTPLGESLYEAVRYFAQISPSFFGTDYTTGVQANDPYYFTSPQWAGTAQYVNCCKSYVIIFTDGQPTQDISVPAGIQDYAHTAASHGTSNHCSSALGCTGTLGTHSNTSVAFHNSLTDHHDNCSAYYGGTTSDPCLLGGSHILDDVAYYAHTVDLRQTTLPVLGAGNNLSGLQNLNIYTFFAFGTGANILKDAAKVGGFTDQNGNNIPDLPAEYDTVNNLTGASGADGVPDNFFEAVDAFQLEGRLLATIASILQKSASGTAVSVLATSSTGDGALYQSYFYPSKLESSTLNFVNWVGYTQGLFLDTFGNLREDTNGDGRLVYQNDNIITTQYDNNTASPTYGQVLVNKFVDANGDGTADSTTPSQANKALSDILPIWEAGKQLALMDPNSRTLLTWADSDNDGLVDAGEQIDFSTANSATLAPYLRAGAAPFTSDNIINFIRGNQVSGLRDRQLTVSGSLRVWKLGDPIDATPTVVGSPRERFDVLYGDASYTAYFQKYQNRRQVGYVGANDGMLHAFNVGFYHKGDDPNTSSATEHGWFTRTATDNSGGKFLGDEMWGFIPYHLLPQLQWLTRSDYSHVFYVDLKPKVTDARIFTPDTDHPNGWGTILIGGFRMGGSCGACVAGTGAPPMTVTANFGSGVQTRTFYSAYFVLDITNPEVNPKLLWVFTNSSLGLTTSYPTVLRVSPSGDAKTDNTNAKWFVAFGSGPTGYDGSIAQTSNLYVIDLKAGPGAANSLVTTMPVGALNAWMGDMISLDKDLDYRADATYGGNVINDGSLPWRGKMYRLTTGSCSAAPCTTGTWGIASGSNRVPTEMLNTFPPSGSTEVGPIVAAPTVTLDESARVWIFFGTGRYYSTADKTNTETQYFFGLKDSVLNGTCTQSSTTSCWNNDLVNVSSATVCIVCTGNQVTGVTGVTSLTGTATTTLQGLIATKDGWYTTLPNSRERVLVSPTLLGGIVYFPSFIPANDICSSAGDGRLYALFYLTGSAYKQSVIGTTTSGGNTNVLSSISLGSGTGLASQMAVQIGAQGSGGAGTGGTGGGCQGGVMGIIQSSTGTLSQSCSNPVGSVASRYISWVKQRD